MTDGRNGRPRAWRRSTASPPAYAVVDMRLGDGNGLDVISALKQRRPDARGIVLTGYGNIATAVTAVKLGAVDYLAKPADADDVVRGAATRRRPAKAEPPENPMSADRVRWEHIQRVYELCDRNVSETARRLNMHRRTCSASSPSARRAERRTRQAAAGQGFLRPRGRGHAAEAGYASSHELRIGSLSRKRGERVSCCRYADRRHSRQEQGQGWRRSITKSNTTTARGCRSIRQFCSRWQRDATAFRMAHKNSELGLAYGRASGRRFDLFWPGAAPQRADRALYTWRHIGARSSVRASAIWPPPPTRAGSPLRLLATIYARK